VLIVSECPFAIRNSSPKGMFLKRCALARIRADKAAERLSDFGVIPLPKRSKNNCTRDASTPAPRANKYQQFLFRMMVSSPNPCLVTTQIVPAAAESDRPFLHQPQK
jgi:hypothetical protein